MTASPTPTNDPRLRKSTVARLGAWSEFQLVLAGPVVSKTAHFAMHRSETEADTGLRLGAVIPKRWAKRAVTRNSIRRQVFALAQEAASVLVERRHVVRLRKAFDRASFPSADSCALRKAVHDELEQLFAGSMQGSGIKSAQSRRGSRARAD